MWLISGKEKIGGNQPLYPFRVNLPLLMRKKIKFFFNNNHLIKY